MFIAEDFFQFKKLFVSKLKSMLADDELGAFILVLANSQQDDLLKNELAGDLKARYIKLKEKFSAGSLDATQDDNEVFRQLLDMELDELPVWQMKSIGEWQVVHNTMRRLRPARASSQIFNTIKQPYDETKFHFNKPFLQPEILWQGLHEKLNILVLFNKFPFCDYHLLIVVSPEKNRSQLLTQEMHQCAFSLTAEMMEVLPGFGIGFNSLAAGASVNHMHFQGFIREQVFAIEENHWQHNGGDIDYPLDVIRFVDMRSSWDYISRLIEDDRAFNCLYRNNSCYVVPRKYQGTGELPDWLAGAGWLDAAGVITVSDEAVFHSIDERSVTRALGLLVNK